MFKYIVLFALIAVACADDDVHAETKALKVDVDAEGFVYNVETSNGISAQASGDIHGNQKGSFSYVDPKGEHVEVTYVADENGFQPSSEWLPTPPPVPEAIQRAIAYINAHPTVEKH